MSVLLAWDSCRDTATLWQAAVRSTGDAIGDKIGETLQFWGRLPAKPHGSRSVLGFQEVMAVPERDNLRSNGGRSTSAGRLSTKRQRECVERGGGGGQKGRKRERGGGKGFIFRRAAACSRSRSLLDRGLILRGARSFLRRGSASVTEAVARTAKQVFRGKGGGEVHQQNQITEDVWQGPPHDW